MGLIHFVGMLMTAAAAPLVPDNLVRYTDGTPVLYTDNTNVTYITE